MQGGQGVRPVTGGDVVGALDIGGTHIAGGRVDIISASVEPRSRISEPLPAGGSRAELLAVISRVARSIAEPQIPRLGVAVPGPFDYGGGISEIAHKLEGLEGVDLRAELCAASVVPDTAAIRFLNDAEAFLLGEWWAGAARGHARVVGITLGTGLGSAFGDAGEFVRSGENVPPNGELYRLDFEGAPVERKISRAGLLDGYGGELGEDDDVEQLAARALEGEEAARDVFTRLGTSLGQFLLPWLRAFEPHCLVVGGSTARSWALFAPRLRAELESAPGLRAVTVADHLEDAPLLGAAYHAAGRP